jgi:hypothetical protein
VLARQRAHNCQYCNQSASSISVLISQAPSSTSRPATETVRG